MEEYLFYLTRYIRCTNMSIWEAHQHAVSRQIAKDNYGVSEKGLQLLDKILNQTKSEDIQYVYSIGST